MTCTWVHVHRLQGDSAVTPEPPTTHDRRYNALSEPPRGDDMAKRISPREAADLMAQGWTYVDVRSTRETQAGRPKGSVCVALLEAGPAGLAPNPDFLATMQQKFAADAKVIIGCEAGGRSARAAAALEAAGFTNVVDQRAGFGGARGPGGVVVEKGWRDEGLPVE